MRRAAAELLLRTAPQAAEQRALASCQERDSDAVVADTCAGKARRDAAETEPVTLLITPREGGAPAPSAPFAVLWADGAVRLGAADRRGALHEPRAPRGAIELLPFAGGD